MRRGANAWIALAIAGCNAQDAAGTRDDESSAQVEYREFGEQAPCWDGLKVSVDGEEVYICNDAPPESEPEDDRKGPSHGAAGSDGQQGDDGEDGRDGAAGSEGQQGEDGEDGRDGSDGTEGKVGPPGPAGPVGPEGPPGPAGEGASWPRTDCLWCTPGWSGCAPDGITVQTCVDDGDGCGHWEASSTCNRACAPAYRQSTRDSLGNQAGIHYRCYEAGECSPWVPCPSGALCVDGTCASPGAPSSSDCRVATPCPSGQACNLVGECEAAGSWLTATATLETAFDGLTHTFVALSETISVTCSTSSTTYWNSTPESCTTISIRPQTWTESSQGSGYGGEPLHPYGALSLSNVTGTGTFTPNCGSFGRLQANRFDNETSSCEVELTTFDPEPGGSVAGTFSMTGTVTGHGEAEGASSLRIDGAFKISVE